MSFRSRFRRGSALQPVNRIKHVIDSQFGASLGVAVQVDLIDSDDNPVIGTPNQVLTGSKVNGIYLKVEAYARTAAALANAYIIIVKNPATEIAGIAPNAVGTNPRKRFVIHQEMVMMERKVNGNPRTLFNGVIVIPRGYRRNGPDDLLSLRFLSPGVDCDVCLQCHYKEFR